MPGRRTIPGTGISSIGIAVVVIINAVVLRGNVRICYISKGATVAHPPVALGRGEAAHCPECEQEDRWCCHPGSWALLK